MRAVEEGGGGDRSRAVRPPLVPHRFARHRPDRLGGKVGARRSGKGCPGQRWNSESTGRGAAMPSRSKRTREPQRAADARGHGGRAAGRRPRTGRFGAAAGLGAGASRADLLLLRRASRGRGRIPADRRGPIPHEVFSRFPETDTPTRVPLAIAWVQVNADQDSLDRLREARTAGGAAGGPAP
jgi:hypothetical protein